MLVEVMVLVLVVRVLVLVVGQLRVAPIPHTRPLLRSNTVMGGLYIPNIYNIVDAQRLMSAVLKKVPLSQTG